MNNPFLDDGGRLVPASSLLTEADYAECFAAGQFAWHYQLYFENSVTFTWAKLGITDPAEIQSHFTAFLKGVRAWLDAAVFPQAYMYSHEVGPVLGLHSHFIIALPAASKGGSAKRKDRVDFKVWLKEWREHRYGRECPRAIRPRGPNKSQPWLHWLLVHYLLKGYDAAAVVQSGHNAPDGRNVFLGDLLVFDQSDPGHVPLNRRYGVSHSLGPDRRALGAPTGLEYALRSRAPVDPFSSALQVPPRSGKPGAIVPASFRSKYEDGVRDVRLLYPPDFLERVEPLLR